MGYQQELPFDEVATRTKVNVNTVKETWRHASTRAPDPDDILNLGLYEVVDGSHAKEENNEEDQR